MLKGLLISTVSLVLIGLAATSTTRGGVRPHETATAMGPTVTADAGAIHSDCLDDSTPRLCGCVDEELTAELERFNEAFATLGPDQLAAFYHQDAMLFVGGTSRFFRDAGRSSSRPSSRASGARPWISPLFIFESSAQILLSYTARRLHR